MIKSVLEYHLKNNADSTFCQSRAVDASGIECGKVIYLNASNAFQGKYTSCSRLPVYARDMNGRIIRKVNGESLGIASFTNIVKFRS